MFMDGAQIREVYQVCQASMRADTHKSRSDVPAMMHGSSARMTRKTEVCRRLKGMKGC